jgi:PIN domain nuclease of toxin-antitoxin system
LPLFENELIVEMERSGFRPLPITFDHASAVSHLPLLHRDPFDRMLIAQARCEDLMLLTADPAIAAYDVRTLDAAR